MWQFMRMHFFRKSKCKLILHQFSKLQKWILKCKNQQTKQFHQIKSKYSGFVHPKNYTCRVVFTWKYDISCFLLAHTNISHTLQNLSSDLWFNLNPQRIGDQNYNLGFSQTTASLSLLISPNSDQYQFFLYSYVIEKKGYTNFKLTK